MIDDKLKKREQFIQAKKIIKTLIFDLEQYFNLVDFETLKEHISEARQFLKDNEKKLLKYITRHIADLTEWDSGALQLWEDSTGNELVDIEWADSVSAFNLQKVLNLICEKGNVTKSELVDECLV